MSVAQCTTMFLVYKLYLNKTFAHGVYIRDYNSHFEINTNNNEKNEQNKSKKMVIWLVSLHLHLHCSIKVFRGKTGGLSNFVVKLFIVNS